MFLNLQFLASAVLAEGGLRQDRVHATSPNRLRGSGQSGRVRDPQRVRQRDRLSDSFREEQV
jgi:hypothetical protein